MKIFKVEFKPLWPVPCGLVIAANDLDEAISIAHNTVKHTDDLTVDEVDIEKSCVIFFESGNY